MTAMIVYGLDALIFVFVQDWFGVFFHIGALAYMLNGYRSLLRLQGARPKVSATEPLLAPEGE